MPGATPQGPKKSGKAKAATDNAEYYVTIADFMVMGMVGYEAQLMPHERHLIVEGLADILQNDERMTKAVSALKPAALVVGSGMWALRCAAIYFTKHPDNWWTKRRGAKVKEPTLTPAQQAYVAQPPPEYYAPASPPPPAPVNDDPQTDPLFAAMSR
jgi:hypothetical protein